MELSVEHKHEMPRTIPRCLEVHGRDDDGARQEEVLSNDVLFRMYMAKRVRICTWTLAFPASHDL